MKQNNDHNDDSENDQAIHVEYPSKLVSFLSDLGIPLKKRAISTLLREIVSLSKKHPDKQLLSYESINGRKYTLLNTFWWHSKKNCLHYLSQGCNNWKNSTWMQQVPNIITPERTNGTENDNKSIDANWILSYYRKKKIQDKFVSVAGNLG